MGRKGTAIDLIEADFSPLKRPSDQRDPIVSVGFSQNIADMVIDSSLADVEAFGDILIC